VSWFCSISYIIVSSSPVCCLIVTFLILSFPDVDAYSTHVNFYGIPFTIINSLYNYYHLLNVLYMVSFAEIL
jgi:hypothetical protein